MTETVHKEACLHLVRRDLQEDVCFGLWNPCAGNQRYTGLISEIILPKVGEREVHGNASFNHTYVDRVFDIAIKKKMGIVFMHSHPSKGWQDMSKPDIFAEKKRLSSRVYSVTRLPLIGMTVGTDEDWSARFWIKTNNCYKRKWCENVRVIGNKLKHTFNERQLPSARSQEELLRTISAWGLKTQSEISNTKVGIIGLGSVGSVIAESLARIGVKNILLLDFDIIERKNLDRVQGATSKDIGKLKVDVIAKSIRLSSPLKDFNVEKSDYSICEEKGFRKALDCDVLFSCVDRPWPRFILNVIAFSYLIPVIDGGIRAKSNRNNTAIKSADWRAHTITHNRVCLECIGQFDSAHVELERSGLMDKPSYIGGADNLDILGGNENVFAFSLSLASLEIQQFLSLIIAPYGIILKPKIYHFIDGSLEDDDKHLHCHENCMYNEYVSKGDSHGLSLTGKHEIAEKMRSMSKNGNTLERLVIFFRRLLNI